MEDWVDKKVQPGREARVFGEGILFLVTSLTKWAVAEHNLPSDMFSMHSLRSGGATCRYLSGVDLEYIRRFGRWGSSTFPLYLHFDGGILRNLSTCLMQCEGPTSQLLVCAEGTQKVVFDKG